jgi:hypothetical protein
MQASVTSLAKVSVALSSALQGSNGVSGMFSLNLLLSLAAIESIANMQYLNINHANIARGAYSGLSSCPVPNWISKANVLNKDLLTFNYGIFAKNQTSSLYLDNYGDSMTENIMYSVVCLPGIVLALFQEKEELVKSRTGKWHAITLGIFLSSIFGQIQSQTLFSILQLLRYDLLINPYSIASYFMAYFTMLFLMGLLTLCLFKLKTIFDFKKGQKKSLQKRTLKNKTKHSRKESSAAMVDIKWTEKKFGMMFEDFKDKTKAQFFFSYLMAAFNFAYILLILLLQSLPVVQCLSLVILVLAFTIFSAILKPMKERSTAYLYFSILDAFLS